MDPIPAESITERGWYWWLSAVVADPTQSTPADWCVRYWDDRDPERFTAGLCIGPLVNPFFQ